MLTAQLLFSSTFPMKRSAAWVDVGKFQHWTDSQINLLISYAQLPHIFYFMMRLAAVLQNGKALYSLYQTIDSFYLLLWLERPRLMTKKRIQAYSEELKTLKENDSFIQLLFLQQVDKTKDLQSASTESLGVGLLTFVIFNHWPNKLLTSKWVLVGPVSQFKCFPLLWFLITLWVKVEGP